jgi:hypothetical protein
MRLEVRLNREQSFALLALAALLLLGGVGSLIAIGALSDAAEEHAERRAVLMRFEAAQRRDGGPGGPALDAVAGDDAFLAAPTIGLAGAQLQAHVARLAARQSVGVVSSGAVPDTRDDEPDAVRLQAIVDLELPALQALLYELEAGTPYVFVEALSIQPQKEARRATDQPLLHVTMNLRALWRRTVS